MANFIKGAIHHAGAEKAAALRNHRSTLQEAEVESHSSDPHVRARGNLAKRFIAGDLHKMRYKGAHEK